MNWCKGTSFKFANNQKWPNAPWEYWMTAGHQNVCVQHWAYLQLIFTIVCLFFFGFFPIFSVCFPPPRTLRPLLYPDSSPIMPVASDGTGVTVHTQGCQWLATVLDAAQTQSSLGIDEGEGCKFVCVYVCWCVRVWEVGGSDRQITGLTQTYPHSPWTKTILSHIGNYAGTSRPNLKYYTTISFL